MDGEALEGLEMSKRVAGRDLRNGGQGKQSRRQLPRMGGEEEEEEAAHVFVFATIPASRWGLEAQLWGGCVGILCRGLLQVAGTKTPVPSGAAPHGYTSLGANPSSKVRGLRLSLERN